MYAICDFFANFFLKEDFITKSTKHNTKSYNYLQNMYKPTTTKISNTVHHIYIFYIFLYICVNGFD